MLGIELNPYAAELARVTVWIGEIQWMLTHGYALRRDPILRPLEHIENRDEMGTARFTATLAKAGRQVKKGLLAPEQAVQRLIELPNFHGLLPGFFKFLVECFSTCSTLGRLNVVMVKQGFKNVQIPFGLVRLNG